LASRQQVSRLCVLFSNSSCGNLASHHRHPMLRHAKSPHRMGDRIISIDLTGSSLRTELQILRILRALRCLRENRTMKCERLVYLSGLTETAAERSKAKTTYEAAPKLCPQKTTWKPGHFQGWRCPSQPSGSRVRRQPRLPLSSQSYLDAKKSRFRFSAAGVYRRNE
jgi:hypothetical protein